jgi:hypothetical protein
VRVSDWAAIATAAGTSAAAAAAVRVASWTDRRAARRLQDEHERSDRLLSAAAGQLGARLIQAVHLEQRDDPGAVAAAELEAAAAGAGWLDPVAVPGRQARFLIFPARSPSHPHRRRAVPAYGQAVTGVPGGSGGGDSCRASAILAPARRREVRPNIWASRRSDSALPACTLSRYAATAA